MHGPGGARPGREQADVAGADLEHRAALDLHRRAAGEHDEDLVGLDVAAAADAVLPDAHLEVGRLVQGQDPDLDVRAEQLLLGQRDDLELGVVEVFTALRGRPARSFPCHLPMLRLDRIYVRGFAIDQAEVHFGAPWNRLSDHAPLTAQLRAH